MTEEKQERDTPRKVREDLTKRIEELEERISLLSNPAQADSSDVSQKLEQLTNAIIDSAHLMGWPKDVLESHGIKAFDKKFDKLKIRQ